MRWTLAAYADLRRIYEFLEPVNASAAVQAVRLVAAKVRRIPAQPRLGEHSPGFADREVRRVLVRGYEIRYEVSGTNLVVLRIFQAREDC